MTEIVKKQVLSYGLWTSPITAGMLSTRVRLEDVQWDSDGQTVVWLEGRGDRGALVAQPAGEARRDLTDEQNVRAGVGYGGGDFTVAGGRVFFAEKDGRLYQRSLGYERPMAITPPFGALASPVTSPDGAWVVYVFSDGKTDLLGVVPADGSKWPVQLAKGADFYMQPVWHPAGDRLAWIEWDHPNMPWDGTRLKLARLQGKSPHLTEVAFIAGDENVPVCQPRFSPNGRWLSYIEGRGEWDDLVLVDLENGVKHALVKGDGFHLSPPAWVQGIHSYGWSANSQRLFYLRYTKGWVTLWSVDLVNGQSAPIDISPYTWLGQLSVSPTGDELAFLASAPDVPTRILRWQEGRLTILARSEGETVAPDYLPAPEAIEWQAPDGTPVHGIFSAPRNPRYISPGLPPTIVNIHGGPTSQVMAGYSPEAAYFTSRGYAWLEVNYRGSTGYGRSYLQALRGRWGEVDVEDAVGAAAALVEQRLADKARLVIKGGSAGGYTVLNALVRHPGVFRAGVCLFGVSNLFNLAMDTHKFEERYLDSMVGPLPEAAQKYHDWSPINHADRIRDALAIFQGSVDKVVPPNQSEEMVNALRRRGVPHLYRLYEGEGHGFRKPETIQDYLTQVERFLRQYVLFTA